MPDNVLSALFEPYLGIRKTSDIARRIPRAMMSQNSTDYSEEGGRKTEKAMVYPVLEVRKCMSS